MAHLNAWWLFQSVVWRVAAMIISNGAIPAAMSSASGSALVAGVPPDPGPGGTAPVRPFRLDQVRLGGGLLQEKRDRIKTYLQHYDERRFLVLFNNQAGRPNPDDVEVPGGWEDGGLLSGHWTGHFMTALSQAYADQGEEIFKSKLDWMVHELAACQDAINARLNGNVTGEGSASWIPTYPGYLGALPEDTVLRLGPPRFAVYGGDPDKNTWAPWYTQHKILRGLLDAYYNTNNTQALEVVVKMAEWAHLALTIGDKNHPDYQGNISRDDLNYMWDVYIAGEYGGANEIFPEVYDLTHDAMHLVTAKAFDNRESLFGAAVEDNDILVVLPQDIPGRRRRERLHANTHVPQFLGYMRVYEQSGEQEYLDAARNFYRWVVPHRQLATGGTGGNYPGHEDNNELFQNRDNIANALNKSGGAETCTTYNMLKLARNLFMHNHSAAYMDDYERGLFNMITGSRADTNSVDDPQLTYFQPLGPATAREYDNIGTCCGGTGMESHSKYQETVYLRSADGSALWVNLYVPATVHWEEKGFTVTQETAFPRVGSSKFTVTAGDGPLDIKLRVPVWTREGGFRVTINGEEQSGQDAQPSTYLTLSRFWQTGDVIEVEMLLSIRVERARDRPDTQAIMWGPVLLQTLGTPPSGDGADGFWQLSLYRYLKLDGDYSRAAIRQTGRTAAGDPLFAATALEGRNVSVRPYYVSDAQAVSSYFRRVEPVVVFGSVDTGIPNRKRNDELPSYDVPVTGVESPGTDGPTFLDLLWDQAPFPMQADFIEAVTSTADSFVALGIYTAEERDVIVAKADEAERELDPGYTQRWRRST
ncbi:putative secreted protein [Phaeoacremonium minimum UCRPA7]|uniref:Putative secreted protein n=1 Tax=Phaeoacremonium minimum (strain UCR-PA7) TaxID=1286976 RepID=R8BTB3_PHAM7|nr:putative secreted protein [Phaeoacremonium minimum UCRPA7]EOO02510.1 putative secreted protein [Phaeoacremonium minimum UCRPA7]